MADMLQGRAKKSRLATGELYVNDYLLPTPVDTGSLNARLTVKRLTDYPNLEASSTEKRTSSSKRKAVSTDIVVGDAAKSVAATTSADSENQLDSMIDNLPSEAKSTTDAQTKSSTAVALYHGVGADTKTKSHTQMLILRQREEERKILKPQWHAPWKLLRIMPGHLGWVRSVAVDVSNEWFATGGGDRMIKIWDMASGALKVSLTGHINSVCGIAISERHPYLFSAGMDKMVKCWDLEQNKVVRHYHGHLSGVYCVKVHPELDLVVTGGRDSAARVWDMRTKQAVRVLAGHNQTISAIEVQGSDPQVITGSHDQTIRTWDIRTGKTISTLTHHKKAVRGLCIHPLENTFVSGAADNLKVWQFPQSTFLRNLSGHNAIINDVQINRDNVLVSCGDNGSMYFWDWKTGYNFQTIQSKVQPGSMESEAGIFAASFDRTGSRLITCEADKSIKMWKEDPEASPETHPISVTDSRKRKRDQDY